GTLLPMADVTPHDQPRPPLLPRKREVPPRRSSTTAHPWRCITPNA
ncbi:hypothetical protein TMBG_03933, partial [Mycobacterium tuberculosis SUMu002]